MNTRTRTKHQSLGLSLLNSRSSCEVNIRKLVLLLSCQLAPSCRYCRCHKMLVCIQSIQDGSAFPGPRHPQHSCQIQMDQPSCHLKDMLRKLGVIANALLPGNNLSSEAQVLSCIHPLFVFRNRLFPVTKSCHFLIENVLRFSKFKRCWT